MRPLSTPITTESRAAPSDAQCSFRGQLSFRLRNGAARRFRTYDLPFRKALASKQRPLEKQSQPADQRQPSPKIKRSRRKSRMNRQACGGVRGRFPFERRDIGEGDRECPLPPFGGHAQNFRRAGEQLKSLLGSDKWDRHPAFIENA